MSESTGKSSVSSLKHICQTRLDDLVRSVEGLQMAIIASDNGFPLASINLDSREGRRVTTLGSSLTDSARKVCSELNLVGLHSATLETDTGMALCRLVDNKVLPMLLMVIIEGDAGGYVQWSVRKCATDLAYSLNQLAVSGKGEGETVQPV